MTACVVAWTPTPGKMFVFNSTVSGGDSIRDRLRPYALEFGQSGRFAKVLKSHSSYRDACDSIRRALPSWDVIPMGAFHDEPIDNFRVSQSLFSRKKGGCYTVSMVDHDSYIDAGFTNYKNDYDDDMDAFEASIPF